MKEERCSMHKKNQSLQIPNVVRFQSFSPSGVNVCKKGQWKTMMVVTETYLTNTTFVMELTNQINMVLICTISLLNNTDASCLQHCPCQERILRVLHMD